MTDGTSCFLAYLPAKVADVSFAFVASSKADLLEDLVIFSIDFIAREDFLSLALNSKSLKGEK